MARSLQPTDYAKSLALLWGSQVNPGRSGLTLKAIVTAAMKIADSEGVDALSMRKVADRLDVGTMTLYTHVPGKGELLELMFDTAYGELYASVDLPTQQGDWRDALRFIAKQNWELYRRHPWMLQLGIRPVLGPHAMLKYEAELRPLDNLELDDLEMDAVLTLILSHVEGCVRAHLGAARTQQDTGMSDAEWWAGIAPVLDKIVDPAHFPVASRVGTTAGETFQATSSPDYALAFGLERILAGVEVLITGKKATCVPRRKPTA